MTVINTNVKSLQAQNALTFNNRNLSTAMQQLSTGSRINSSKDDAAGIAISDKMTAQIRGLNQAVRNANDGIGLLQTAEGAMVEITSMMQRMRELAIQSANDTNAQDDRNYLDLEFQQLKQEINRITKNTQWNGMNILDQTEPASGKRNGEFTFQVGANNGAAHKITHTFDKLTFGDGGSGATAVATPSAVSGVQTTTVAFGDGFLEGDVITLTVNNKQFQYTVTADDVGAGTSAGDVGGAVAASIAAAIGETFSGLKVDVSAADLTFEGADGEVFDTFTKVSNGRLASIDALNIKNQSNSDLSISGIDKALTIVNEARAEIGAVINRLTYAADNLANVSMNTSESRSRILDTDYAKTSAELARTQIISQAATAMLAQANQQPQAVLQLLQG
jgi:flagellin